MSFLTIPKSVELSVFMEAMGGPELQVLGGKQLLFWRYERVLPFLLQLQRLRHVVVLCTRHLLLRLVLELLLRKKYPVTLLFATGRTR